MDTATNPTLRKRRRGRRTKPKPRNPGMDAAAVAKLSPEDRKAFTRACQKAAGKRKREKRKAEMLR